MQNKLLNYLKNEIDKALRQHTVSCIYVSSKILQQCLLAKMLLSDVAKTVKLANAYSLQQRNILATKRICFITCKNYMHKQQF